MDWKFLGWRDIYGRDGEHWTPYMTQIWIGRLRLHIFHRGDADPDCHDHPWEFWTFPLNSYVEEVAETRTIGKMDLTGEPYEINRKLVEAFSVHYRPADYAHRVVGRASAATMFRNTMGEAGQLRTEPGKIVTVVWRGKGLRKWGFLKRRGKAWCWVPWKEYVYGEGKNTPC